MKTITALLIILFSLCAAANAQLPETGGIGIYLDLDHSTSEIWNEGGALTFRAYIFCQPSADGMMCAEYAVTIPDNVGMAAGWNIVNPEVSIELGEPFTGTSICFPECRTEWIWTHAFDLVLIGTDPSTIEIVMHAAVDRIQFSTCEEGFPVEYVYYLTPLFLNQTAETDLEPPFIESVVSVDSIAIDVVFNESIFRPDLESTSSYILKNHSSKSGTIPVLQVNIKKGSGNSATLYCASSLKPGDTYALSFVALRDLAGNETAPEYEYVFEAGDAVHPQVVRIDLISSTVFNAVFDEELDSVTAGDVSNYLIMLTADRDVYHEWKAHPDSATVLADGRTVRFKMVPGLPQDRTYFFYIEGVEDLYGNATPYAYRTRFYLADIWPPALVLVEVIDSMTVRLGIVGNPLPEPLEDISNYSLFESGDSHINIPIISADVAVPYVTVHLADSLTRDVLYMVEVFNLVDAKGNFEERSYKVFIFDDTPPAMMLARSTGSKTIEVFFNDIIAGGGGSETPLERWKVTMLDSGGEITIPLSGATLLEDHATIRLELYWDLWIGEEYRISAFGIMDTSNNRIMDWDRLSFVSRHGLMSRMLGNNSVEYKGDGVEITWELAAEPEGKSFSLLKRSPDEQNWKESADARLNSAESRYWYVDDDVEPGMSYIYCVLCSDLNGLEETLFETSPVEIPVANLTLYPNMPNPFNPATRLVFLLPAKAPVSIRIYDVTGKIIRTLIDGVEECGRHEIEWDGLDDRGTTVASGIYFCMIVSGEESRAIKMVLLR